MIVCENTDVRRFVQDSPRRLTGKVLNDELREWLLADYQPLDERIYGGVYLAS